MPEVSLLVCPFTCRWKEEEGGVEDEEKITRQERSGTDSVFNSYSLISSPSVRAFHAGTEERETQTVKKILQRTGAGAFTAALISLFR
jgi:hypothetical protein